MIRGWTIFALVIVAALPVHGWMQANSATSQQAGTAEQPYTPAVPAASMVTGYGGWPSYQSGASTVAGSAMNGMASVISASGDAALSASAAAINLTQAEKQEIQNRQAWTNTYFDMRATNRAARSAERGQPLSMEQLAKIAHDGVPKPLNNGQFNPVSGKLNWPGPLQDEAFASQRDQLDKIMAQQAHYGRLAYSDQKNVKQIVNTMFAQLKSQVNDIPANEYVDARKFLNSVLFATTKSQLG